jgi:hypothetical protein
MLYEFIQERTTVEIHNACQIATRKRTFWIAFVLGWRSRSDIVHMP